MTRVLARLWAAVAGAGRGLVLPPACPACRNRLTATAAEVCADCRRAMPELPLPRCPGCGGALDGVLELCPECLQTELHPWRRAVSVFEFGGDVRECIHRFKYQGGTELAPWLAARMAAAWERHGGGAPDAVAPVPLHWFKEWRRGYNQAGLLAELVAARLDVPVQAPLRRRRWTRQQAKLHCTARKNNMKGAFVPRRHAGVEGRHILLVDDVMTTGATLGEAAQALLAAGANQVSVLTAARG